MIDIQIDMNDDWDGPIDWQNLSEKSFTAASAQTDFPLLADMEQMVSISIILSDNVQIHELNRQYRDKDKPTNILSFPMLDAAELKNLPNMGGGEMLLGDLALAYEICAQEAEEKGISLEQHVAHLIVHGTLHLLGYDHIEDAEADAMEGLEIKALASMGLPNPYSVA